MEARTAKLSDSMIARTLLSLVIFFLSCAVAPSNSLADGKLRRAKQAVRKHSPPKPSPTTRPDREDRSDSHQDHDSQDEDHSRDDNDHGHGNPRHSNRDHHNHDSRPSGVVFFSSPPPRCAEPVFVPVVETHIVAAPQPVYAYPPHNQSEYGSSIVEVAQPVPAQHYLDPIPLVEEAPIIQETVVIENGIGDDLFFGTGPSRIWATVGTDFDGVTTGGFGLLAQERGGLGLDASVFTLRESTPTYRDHLWIGDANLVYEAISGDVSGRIGIGVNWLSDAWGVEAGFNLTAGVDVPLTDRLLISAEGDVGNLGDADFFHGRVNLARRFEQFEWMLGADHYNIGGAEINTYFTGIQFRF